MQKTKLGISAGLLGAAVCFTALFGGYTPTLLLVGYILLVEENGWLRRNSVKMVALMMAFSALSTVIGLIPDFLSWISTIVGVFNGNFNFSKVNMLVSAVLQAIAMIKIVVYLLMGKKALTQGTIHIAPIDNMVNKYI